MNDRLKAALDQLYAAHGTRDPAEVLRQVAELEATCEELQQLIEEKKREAVRLNATDQGSLRGERQKPSEPAKSPSP